MSNKKWVLTSLLGPVETVVEILRIEYSLDD